MRRTTTRAGKLEQVVATAVAGGLIAFTASTAAYVAASTSSAAGVRPGPQAAPLALTALSAAAGAHPVPVDPPPAALPRSTPPSVPPVAPPQVSRSQVRAPLVAAVPPVAGPLDVAAPVASWAPTPVPVAVRVPAAPAAPAAVSARPRSISPSGLGARAVALAAAQNGAPYAYGGASPGGFDCSGLTSYVYGSLGSPLPHNSDAQYWAVTHIARGDVAPGDLVFFGSPGAIYHVGIYAGNNMIEHAPSPGGVVSLAPIWTADYLVGRP